MSFKIIKNYLLLLTIISVALFSCSDDNDEGPVGVSGSLIGEWSASSAQVDELTINGQDFSTFLSGLGLPTEFVELFEEEFAGDDLIDEFVFDITFNEGGTYLLEDTDGSETGTWELISNNSKILLDKGTEDEFEMDIVELTDVRLETSISEVDNSEDIDEDGTNDEISLSISLIFTR